MAKIEDWHRRAAVHHYSAIAPVDSNREEVLAQIIAKYDPANAPASTAPKEVVEKYEMELDTMCTVDYGADTAEYLLDPGQSRDFLTRFASEIRVDAGKVWEYLVNIPRDRYVDPTEDVIALSKSELAAALKAAGGGK